MGIQTDFAGAAHREDQPAALLDRRLNAWLAHWTLGLSPASSALAWMDWAWQWQLHPARAGTLLARLAQLALANLGSEAAHASLAADSRFAHPAWNRPPWRQAALLQQAMERWWEEAAALPGMEPHHVSQVRFLARQAMEANSPASRPWLRPDVMERTRATLGRNIVHGLAQSHDQLRRRHGLPPVQPGTAFRPGREVAATPGRVVYRNHLAELIQYSPTTRHVQAEPVFIVPSWIMKYYILDLSPHNSLVRWLVGQGHTVFILSWRNPDGQDALLTLQDYLDEGVFDMLAAIGELVPGDAVHACGYCLGGTLLALAAAALGGRTDRRNLPALRTLTLLTAEVDFSDPGEMGVLIDEAQVSLLEDMMSERGFLSGAQMAGSFTFLHARELYWSQQAARWLDEAVQPNDLMAWNADVTRMPAAMHSEYLRRCYLHNEIAQDRFPVDGRPVSLDDIAQPVFLLGTEKDHVVPWPSVYQLHRLCSVEITFVLASGGHNAGVVSEPGHAGRRFAMATRPSDGSTPTAQEWLAASQQQPGSWWPAWADWLRRRGSGRSVPARTVAPGEGPAPGRYVHVRYFD